MVGEEEKEVASVAHAHLIERLSAQDLAALWWDDYGWPGDIGGLVIVDAECVRLVNS